MTEFLVELIGIEGKNVVDVAGGELPALDAGVTAQNGGEHQARAAIEVLLPLGSGGGQREAFGLGKGCRRIGGGDGVEIHGALVAKAVERSERQESELMQNMDDVTTRRGE